MNVIKLLWELKKIDSPTGFLFQFYFGVLMLLFIGALSFLIYMYRTKIIEILKLLGELFMSLFRYIVNKFKNLFKKGSAS